MLEQFDIDIFDLEEIPAPNLINLINEVENRALRTLENWQPSKLN